jgi:hypothetical protein
MTKTLMTTAIVMLMSSLNASANFQPWEAECSKHHGRPALFICEANRSGGARFRSRPAIPVPPGVD